MKIKTTFGVLDVLGRKNVDRLSERVAAAPVRVTIDAEIVGENSRFDGTSMEFELKVISVKEQSA